MTRRTEQLRALGAKLRETRPTVVALPGGYRMMVNAPNRWGASLYAACLLGSGAVLGFALAPALSGDSEAATNGRARVVVVGGLGGGTSSSAPAATAASSGSGSSAASSDSSSGSSSSATPAAAQPVDTGGSSSSGGGSSSSTTDGSLTSGTSSSTPSSGTTTTPPGANSVTTPPSAGSSPTGTGTPTATDQSVSGMIAHVAAPTKTYVIATSGGQLYAVHAATLPQPGQAATAKLHKLANGTYREDKLKTTAGPSAAKLAGTVTVVDAASNTYSLSARGASLLIHVPPATPTAPQQPLPAAGATATVDVSVAPSPSDPTRLELTQTAIENTQAATAPVDLVGTLASIDTQARKLVLPADDVGESGRQVTIVLPAAIDITSFKQADVIDATVKIGTDGSYTLTGASHDQDATAADDPAQAVGDQKQQSSVNYRIAVAAVRAAFSAAR